MRRFLTVLLFVIALATGLVSWAQSHRWRYDQPEQQTLSSLDSVIGTPSSATASSAPSSTEVPGPSLALFNQPFYTCVRNFYVATTGSDSNDGSAGSPWLTIQKADTSARTGGDCINVAPGTYQARVVIEHGGNVPTATGYVVYRCQVMDACHVLAPGSGSLWAFGFNGNFVVVDGFELDGNNALQADGVAGVCFVSSDPAFGRGVSATQAGGSSHHLWAINNIIHHCNLAGIGLQNKEWYYAIHNTVYHNAFTSGFQGSGIGYVSVQCIEANVANCYTSGISGTPASDYSYVPSGNDLTFNPPAGYAPFHNVVAWNVVYNNRINYNSSVACQNHTDGNGIILDTFLDGFSNTLVYPFQTLAMGNISYYNGGRGIEVFRSSNITVANNTVFNNGTDTCLQQTAFVVGDLSQNGGTNNIWVNNVALSVQGAFGNNCSLNAGNSTIADANNTYLNNVFGVNPANPQMSSGRACLFDSDVTAFSCSNNKCGVDPLFANATAGVAAQTSNNQPPGGTWVPGNSNFAITASSPALNYIQTEPFLPAQLSDAGACSHTLISCPEPFGVNTHDFNGDGKSDIVWRDTSGNVAMWLMNGAQIAQSAGVGAAPIAAWSIIGQRDFNGDGKADLLWRDNNGNLAMWFMNGTQVTQSAGVGNIPAVWSVVGIGDFNGDGKGDILWQDTSGNLAMWLMNGTQVSQSVGVGNLPPSVWKIVGTGDFNGDGKSDLLWQDTSGNVTMWFMNGAQVAQSAGVGNIPPNVWSIQAANAD